MAQPIPPSNQPVPMNPTIPTEKAKDPAEFAKMDAAAKAARSRTDAPVQKLLQVGKSILSNKDLLPKNGKTFCNYAVSYAAKCYGYDGFSKGVEPLLANDIINKMAMDKKNWKPATSLEAWDHALKGGLAVASFSEAPHGHVAVLSPGARVWSSHFDAYCPQVFNVGKSVGLMGENFAFQIKPNHYLYVGLPKLS